MRQVLHAYYLQALPVQAQARSERVNNNIGPNKKIQRLASWMVCQTFGQTQFHILKSVSDPMLCATYTYSIMSIFTSKPNFYFQAKLVNNYVHKQRLASWMVCQTFGQTH
jgi:hypothetical protein